MVTGWCSWCWRQWCVAWDGSCGGWGRCVYVTREVVAGYGVGGGGFSVAAENLAGKEWRHRKSFKGGVRGVGNNGAWRGMAAVEDGG
nr:hypothetical protein [Tanacetum cinerariifolium]